MQVLVVVVLTVAVAWAVFVTVFVGLDDLREWLASRRHRKPQEPLPDECEVCGKRARTNVTVGAVTPRPGIGGFSGITATWCVEHCPEEHRPAP